jgi:hypothetical protein
VNKLLVNPLLVNPLLVNPLLVNPLLVNPLLVKSLLVNPLLVNSLLVNPLLVNPLLVNPLLVNPLLVNPLPRESTIRGFLHPPYFKGCHDPQQTTFIITTRSMIINKCYNTINDTHYTECQAFIVMLSASMLNVIMPSVMAPEVNTVSGMT